MLNEKRKQIERLFFHLQKCYKDEKVCLFIYEFLTQEKL